MEEGLRRRQKKVHWQIERKKKMAVFQQEPLIILLLIRRKGDYEKVPRKIKGANDPR